MKYLICRDISGVRHTLCYDRVKSEAAWISEERYPEVKERFRKVEYSDHSVAENRARTSCRGTYVLQINQ